MFKYYDLAIIGGGSAAAYYLNTLDRSFYSNILVIGDADPWNGRRGLNRRRSNDPVNIVNHTAQMIDHFGASVPAHTSGGYGAMVRRTDWAAKNRSILQSANRFVVGRVRSLSESYFASVHTGGRHLKSYKIVTTDRTVFFAYKVIVASGAGGHRLPDECKAAQKARPDRVMDMDAFAQKIETIPPRAQTVFVLGGNAAIDTVETAKFNGMNVVWLIRAKEGATKGTYTASAPVLLDTGHQVYARNQEYINYIPGSLKVEAAGDRLRVQYKSITPQRSNVSKNPRTEEITPKANPVKDEPVTRWGEFFVYATGQDDKEALSFIDADLRTQLEPITDVNQRFGAAHESVLGFQVEGTSRTEGLEIIGALATQTAKYVDLTKWTEASLRPYREGIASLRFAIQRTGEVLTAIRAEKPANSALLDQAPDTLSPVELTSEALAVFSRMIIQHTPRGTMELGRTLIDSLVNVIGSYRELKGLCDTATAVPKQKHLEKWTELLNNPVKILTGSVVGAGQAGGVRTTTQAINGFEPKYARPEEETSGDVNFSHDDRTVLRLYVAANYPLVPEGQAQALIEDVLRGRKKSGQGWGYEPAAVERFKVRLRTSNDRARERLRACVRELQ